MTLAEKKDAILLIDDDEELTDVLSILLGREGYEIETAATPGRAIQLLRSRTFSLVLLDLRLGEDNGLQLLGRIRDAQPDGLPVFVITAHGDVDSAVEAFTLGADGYIRKPFQEGAIKTRIAEAIQAFRIRLEVFGGGAEAGAAAQGVRGLLRTRDPVMEPLLRRVATAAQVTSSVVITGESGTGKELVARALHQCGPRKAAPFIAFNCAALPETLLESELFGHVRGAFTDARENKQGLFAKADGGTLFIDEIGDAPLSIQAKLLRVLQEREFVPIGGLSPIRVDVRVIAATHRSLQEEVARGRFRQDLYYRLHVLPIHLPPLRERKKDITFLATLFATRLGAELGVRFDGFSAEAERAMVQHEWPGNVRELQNRIEHALVIARGGRLGLAYLFPERADADAAFAEGPGVEGAEATGAPAGAETEAGARGTGTLADPPGSGAEALPTFFDAKIRFERGYLEQLLLAARGNIAKAARLASKSRTEVYSLLRKHRMDAGAFKGADAAPENRGDA